MIYTPHIQKAIHFSLVTHEIHQKQKRKGKDIPYVMHPLQVGIILSLAGCDEDVVAAGVLHDTIEDSVVDKKVTRAALEELFGKRVADIVDSVSETDETFSWEERKAKAVAHIEEFSHDSVLVKSADVLANGAELLADIAEHGESVFRRFAAPKDRVLANQLNVIAALLARCPMSPLADDLTQLAAALRLVA